MTYIYTICQWIAMIYIYIVSQKAKDNVKNSFISPLVWKLAKVQCKCHVFLSLSLIWSNSVIILLSWKHAESQNNAYFLRAFRISPFFFYRATSITLIKLPTHALWNNGGPFRRLPELSHGGAFQVGSLLRACNLRRRIALHDSEHSLHRTWQ